ncbi:MAG: hypothetical protein HRT44_02375 [Bdellovibrionales bacterium]|nr:hypothetical protein [Bdellovibrionales bacterium]NQZ18093.1 hypothetical protein [Bdellovibrionales bacterium]
MRLLALILLLGLTACNSAWEQNPFRNEDPNVQDAVDPINKDKPQAPISQAIFIDIEPFYELNVGQRFSMKITIRETDPTFERTSVEIEDLEESYPGAEFDEDALTVNWTPPADYVPPSKFIRRTPLKVTVFGIFQGAPRSYTKSTSINVLKGNIEAPVIVGTEGFDQKFVENAQHQKVIVYVRDTVSPQGPTLSILPGVNFSDRKNGAAFIDTLSKVQDQNDPTLWIFTGKLDLESASDITSYSQLMDIRFVAHSTFGEPSSSVRESFRVYTDLEKPRVFSRNQTFKKDTFSSYSFAVVDPKNEGTIDAQFVTDCSRAPHADFDCRCEPPNGGVSQCTIEGVPKTAESLKFDIKAINTIDTSAHNVETSTNHTIQIDVVE